jgi:hypothetical protein
MVNIDLIDYDKLKKTTAQIFKNLACSSDAVFIGALDAVAVFPTEDGTFLFSEYSVRPTEDFPARQGRIAPLNSATVLWPGGTTQIEGTTVSARITGHPSLEVGARYLIFATRVAETGAYRPVPNGVLRVENDHIRAVYHMNTADAGSGQVTFNAARIRTLLNSDHCR